MSVWITRSAPDNLRTARELRALGQLPLMVPVMTTAALEQPTLAALPDAVVFTSVHALRHFAWHAQLASVPVFVAAGSLAEVAVQVGYATVSSTGGDEAQLAQLVAHVVPPGGRVLVLCGERTSSGLDDWLAARGCRVERRVVYRPAPVDDEALAGVAAALDRVTAVVVHSRGGAELVVPVLRRARWRGSMWCISEQATRVCEGLDAISVHTAAWPSEVALVDMIAGLASATARRGAAVRSNDALVRAALRPSPYRAGNDNSAGGFEPDGPGPHVA